MKKSVSIIIPAYNEMQNVKIIVDELLNEFKCTDIKFKICFVDDGSSDGTWEEIEKLTKKFSQVNGIKFSRNFGKEAAIFAGLAEIKSDCYIVMDCDLQHPPCVINKMIEKWQKEGYLIVEGIKRNKDNNKIKRVFPNLFYSLFTKVIGFDMRNSSDFKLVDKKVVDLITNLPERRTFFRALTFWTGFPSARIYYDVRERRYGTSKWSFKSLIYYALRNLMSYSAAPLMLVTYAGSGAVFIAGVLGVQTLWRFLSSRAVEGFTTVILLILFFGGIILMSIGLIGRYIAAIYDEIKMRPRYIIESVDINNEEEILL